MNKHILLVMKWLNDKDSVTQEELEANLKAADAAYYGAAYWSAYWAADYAAGDWDADWDAAYWVDIYFERSGENKEDYIKELTNPSIYTETATSVQHVVDYINASGHSTNINVVKLLLNKIISDK